MNYLKQNNFDMLNGNGIRVSLWVAGCNNFCSGCHNPETWDPKAGDLFDEKALNKLMCSLDEDHIAGLTLTGGDPMYPANREEILNIVRTFREKFDNQKSIWLWTGFLYEDLMEDDVAKQILENIDVLVDGKFEKDKKQPSLKWKGSSNQRVIDLVATRRKNELTIIG